MDGAAGAAPPGHLDAQAAVEIAPVQVVHHLAQVERHPLRAEERAAGAARRPGLGGEVLADHGERLARAVAPLLAVEERRHRRQHVRRRPHERAMDAHGEPGAVARADRLDAQDGTPVLGQGERGDAPAGQPVQGALELEPRRLRGGDGHGPAGRRRRGAVPWREQVELDRPARCRRSGRRRRGPGRAVGKAGQGLARRSQGHVRYSRNRRGGSPRPPVCQRWENSSTGSGPVTAPASAPRSPTCAPARRCQAPRRAPAAPGRPARRSGRTSPNAWAA